MTGLTGGPGGPGGPFGPNRPRGPCKRNEEGCPHLAKSPHPSPAPGKSCSLAPPRAFAATQVSTSPRESVASALCSPASPPHPPHLSTSALGGRGRTQQLTGSSDRGSRGCTQSKGSLSSQGASFTLAQGRRTQKLSPQRPQRQSAARCAFVHVSLLAPLRSLHAGTRDCISDARRRREDTLMGT